MATTLRTIFEQPSAAAVHVLEELRDVTEPAASVHSQSSAHAAAGTCHLRIAVHPHRGGPPRTGGPPAIVAQSRSSG